MELATFGGPERGFGPRANALASSRMTVHIEGGAAQLSGLRHVARCYLRTLGVDTRATADVVLAVHEAAVNAVRHGDGAVEIEIEIHDHEIATTVRDEGAGIDPAALEKPCPGLEESGRGLYLMRSLMDDVAVTTGPRPSLRMVRAV